MKNILSIDVESWVHFYLDAMKEKKRLDSATLKRLDGGYVERAINDLLHLLAWHNQTATFFMVAEIYDWYPDAVKSIRSAGHEVAYHTYSHHILTDDHTLNEELDKSHNFFAEFHPIGFRAPFIHIFRDYYLTLRQNGFLYSSSTYGRTKVHNFEGVDEIPVSSLGLFNERSWDDTFPKNFVWSLSKCQIPFGSGLFLALAGRHVSYFIDKYNKANLPTVLFIHPEQLYDHDRIRGRSFTAKILRRNPFCLPYLINVMPTFSYLLTKYKFVSFKQYYYEH